MKLPISTLGPTLGLLAALAVGCGSAPVPASRVASAETAVQSARQAGAGGSPQASAQLKLAEDELARAKTLMREGDNDQASAMFTRAEADAALAAALTREARQKAATDAAMQRVHSMQTTPTPTPMLEPSR